MELRLKHEVAYCMQRTWPKTWLFGTCVEEQSILLHVTGMAKAMLGWVGVHSQYHKGKMKESGTLELGY